MLWHWGDLARVRLLLFERAPLRVGGAGKSGAAVPADAVTPVADVAKVSAPAEAVSASPVAEAVPAEAQQSDDIAAGAVISAELGRAFLRRRPEAWRITAALFDRTFAHAPGLLLRLYTADDAENLCRLGRILEKAAPCVGAERLASAAHTMQWAVNDTDAASAAQAVEECVLALREVLEALEGLQLRKKCRPSPQEGGR